MKPLLAEPENTFAEVTSDNAGLHRREYMPSEIVRAMNMAGLQNCNFDFVLAQSCFDGKKAFANFVFSPVHRFRPHMIVSGEKIKK